MSITPKNWSNFQHYKDRSPSWIKLHRGLLDDFEFARLPVASRALAPLLWLLASEYERGEITASIEELAFRFRMPVDEMAIAISPLIECGFFNSSTPLADCKQDASPEKRDIEQNIDKRERENGADAPLDPAIPEREFFKRGKEVLGSGAGGLLAKLLKAKGGNVALARAALEQASTKENSTEYIAAVCRGPPVSTKPLTEFQRKQQETNDVRQMLRNSAATARSGGAPDRVLSIDHGERPGDLRSGAGPHVFAVPSPSRSGSG